MSKPSQSRSNDKVFVVGQPKGLLNPGNININDRPIVANPEAKHGETSTVFSMGIEMDGKHILIPRVSDGADGKPPHVMEPKEAIEYFKKTKQHLGVFSSDKEADEYGDKTLHVQQSTLKNKDGRTYYENPNSEIEKNNALVKQQSMLFGGRAVDKKAKFDTAIAEKNPLVLHSFEDQGASVQAKIIRLANNPEYQKLTPSERVGVRARIYDQYVVPAFKQAGHAAPDKKQWLLGTKTQDVKNINPEEYYSSPSAAAAHDVITGAVNAAQKTALFGLKILNTQLMANYDLGHYFQTGKLDASVNEAAAKDASKTMLGRAQRSVQDGLNQTNFWLASHPREGLLANASRWTGEQIVQLPLYEAAGSARMGVGLTEKLATSAVGKFVAKRIGDAADGFIGSLASGDSAKTAAGNAAGFAAFGAAGDALKGGAAKVASAPLIKKWTAQLLAMGGKPLSTELTHSAYSELVRNGGHGIQNLKAGDLDYVEIGAKNAHMLGDVAVAPDATSPSAGHLVYDGKIYPYKDQAQQQEIYSQLEKMAEEHRKVEDPLLHRMHDAEKLSVESIAMRHFGTPIRKLTPEQQSIVLKRRLELIDEAAAELPSHVPDLNKAEVEHSHVQEMQENPIFGRNVAEFEAAFPGIKIVDVVNENQINDIEKQTGITNSPNTAKKLKASKEITLARAPSGTKDTKIGPDAFASHRVDSISYFKNPSNKAERLASDGTAIGGRDKRSWNERLKSENTEQFVETLREADGNKIKFENPYHRMLFHWANRESLPVPVRDKLLREMKKVTEKQKRYGLKGSDFNKEADWALIHLTKLAQSGRLSSERNVFASTHLQGPMAFTPWQVELQTEIDQQEMELLNKTMSRHPAGKKALDSTVKMFQANRFDAKTPEDWLTYNKVISNLTSGVIK